MYKKKHRNYTGFGVSQTPKIHNEKEMKKVIIEGREIKTKKFDSLQKLIIILTSYQKLFRTGTEHIKLYAYLNNRDRFMEEYDEVKCNLVLKIIAAKLKIHPPVFTNMKPEGISCIDAAINRVLKYDPEEWFYLSKYNESDLNIDIEKAVSASFSIKWKHVDLMTQSEIQFTAYYKGNPENECIVFVLPCGMPVEAFSVALEKLQEQYFVITWENPFLFHSICPDSKWSISDDIQCIKKIIQFFKRPSIHLIGACGGVPIAIAAAAELKEQVVSLSSCHGDIYLGSDSPMTPFKKQFLALLQSSLENEKNAREIYTLLLDPTLLLGISDRLAPYIIYQYLSFELYVKYANINSVLMTLDLNDYLDELKCYLLVISSEDDRIAHPDVSKLLNEKVKDSVLWMRPHADHYNAILGDDEVYKKIMNSIENYKLWYLSKI